MFYTIIHQGWHQCGYRAVIALIVFSQKFFEAVGIGVNKKQIGRNIMTQTYKNFVSLAVAALGAASAVAGPIPASPSPTPSSGESLWDSFSASATDAGVNVDWMVYQLAAGNPFGAGYVGQYIYLYQLEVSSTATVGPSLFSVTFDTALNGVTAGDAGFLFGDDLDSATASHAAHTVVGEMEGFALQTTVAPFSVAVNAGNVTWTFPDLSTGEESDTLYFISPIPPVYGNGNAADTTPPSPWGSLAPGSQPVPVPSVPDGGLTLALLGFALVGVEFMRRRFVAA